MPDARSSYSSIVAVFEFSDRCERTDLSVTAARETIKPFWVQQCWNRETLNPMFGEELGSKE